MHYFRFKRYEVSEVIYEQSSQVTSECEQGELVTWLFLSIKNHLVTVSQKFKQYYFDNFTYCLLNCIYLFCK